MRARQRRLDEPVEELPQPHARCREEVVDLTGDLLVGPDLFVLVTGGHVVAEGVRGRVELVVEEVPDVAHHPLGDLDTRLDTEELPLRVGGVVQRPAEVAQDPDAESPRVKDTNEAASTEALSELAVRATCRAAPLADKDQRLWRAATGRPSVGA